MVRMQTNKVAKNNTPSTVMCPGYCCSERLLAHSIENALAVVLDVVLVFAQVL